MSGDGPDTDGVGEDFGFEGAGGLAEGGGGGDGLAGLELEVDEVLAEGGGVDGEEIGAFALGAGGVKDEEGLTGEGVDAGVVLEVLEELGAEGEFERFGGEGVGWQAGVVQVAGEGSVVAGLAHH